MFEDFKDKVRKHSQSEQKPLSASLSPQVLEKLKKENVLLRREAYMLEKDPSYIEHAARRELGLVSEGEVEYRFKKQGQ